MTGYAGIMQYSVILCQVLDLGQVVAGNFAGALLAYFGATVRTNADCHCLIKRGCIITQLKCPYVLPLAVWSFRAPTCRYTRSSPQGRATLCDLSACLTRTEQACGGGPMAATAFASVSTFACPREGMSLSSSPKRSVWLRGTNYDSVDVKHLATDIDVVVALSQ